MTRPIYLDYQATTPVDPRVLEAMLPFFVEEFGNAASRTHAYGWRAEEAVESARREVATLVGATPREIVFTSGATESNNLAILGSVRHVLNKSLGRKTNLVPVHVVTSRIEHHAVLDPCRELERHGVEVTYLNPDSAGRITAAQVADAVTENTVLVSIMAAHNEIGTLYPVAEIGEVCRQRSVLFHTDAAQAVGKIPLDVNDYKIDLLSLSGHKLYGPKGIGALYVGRRTPRIRLEPLVYGGGHERGLRSGTLNVPGVVGLGTACRIAGQEMTEEAQRLSALRERFLEGVLSALDGVHLNGDANNRLPGNLNLSFERVEGEALIISLKSLAVSSGSACTSQVPEASYVLRALGVSSPLAHSSLRFGLGRYTIGEEVDRAIETIVSVVNDLRKISAAISEPIGTDFDESA
jgi:cysteine desulfurase